MRWSELQWQVVCPWTRVDSDSDVGTMKKDPVESEALAQSGMCDRRLVTIVGGKLKGGRGGSFPRQDCCNGVPSRGKSRGPLRCGSARLARAGSNPDGREGRKNWRREPQLAHTYCGYKLPAFLYLTVAKPNRSALGHKKDGSSFPQKVRRGCGICSDTR